MHAPINCPSPRVLTACVGGRPCAPKASRHPTWQYGAHASRQHRGSAARGGSEQQGPQAASTAADDEAAGQQQQPASSASVSSTLDSLDALLSSGSIDAEDDLQPGASRPSSYATLL